VNEFKLEQLATSWIRLHHAEMNSEEYEKDFWSFEKLSEFCRKNPEDAWRVIVKIYENHPDEKILSNLAAGPLEDLLVNHGRLALIWIDQYCMNESDLVKVLQMVWRNAMSEEVWGGLNRLIKEYS